MSAMARITASSGDAQPAVAAAVRKAERRRRWVAFVLMAPSVAFTFLFFAVPIGLFLFRAIENDAIPKWLPQTIAAAQDWSGDGAPEPAVYRPLAEELLALKGTPELAQLARRLNYAVSGYRSLLMATGRSIDSQLVAGTSDTAIRDWFVDQDERWADPAFWVPLREQSGALTTFYLETALDLQRTADGSLERVPADRAVFIDLYWRTLEISLGVTVICVLIGFPVAAVMASASAATANLLLAFVLIPFWTSLLVRTTAWVILLQSEGPVNRALIDLGLVDGPLQLIYNRFGVYVAMVHVLLPYMILPLYAVLKGISRSHLNAASSLGAAPMTVFRTVYLPLALPGLAAGATLVFVLSVGFYVTPALVGGAGDQMIGYFIAYFTNSAVNWGLAAALGAFLLLLIVAIYVVLGRAVGLERLRVR